MHFNLYHRTHRGLCLAIVYVQFSGLIFLCYSSPFLGPNFSNMTRATNTKYGWNVPSDNTQIEYQFQRYDPIGVWGQTPKMYTHLYDVYIYI
jgi:hypothetical protein